MEFVFAESFIGLNTFLFFVFIVLLSVKDISEN